MDFWPARAQIPIITFHRRSKDLSSKVQEIVTAGSNARGNPFQIPLSPRLQTSVRKSSKSRINWPQWNEIFPCPSAKSSCFTGQLHKVWHRSHPSRPHSAKKKGYLHNSKKMLSNVVLPGIEPGLARPQRDVLPLDHSTRCYWSVRWLCYPEKVALKVIFRLRIWWNGC